MKEEWLLGHEKYKRFYISFFDFSNCQEQDFLSELDLNSTHRIS